MPVQTYKTGHSERQEVYTTVLVWVIIAGVCAFLANVIAAEMLAL